MAEGCSDTMVSSSLTWVYIYPIMLVSQKPEMFLGDRMLEILVAILMTGIRRTMKFTR